MAIQLSTPLGNTGVGDYGVTMMVDPPDMERKLTTKGLWSSTLGELKTFFTSSAQYAASKEYHYEIWSSASLVCGDEVVFSVAYGHISGSGSVSAGGQTGDTPTRAIYSQYKTMLLDGDANSESSAIGSDVSQFVREDGVKIEQFYVVNISRNRFEDKLDPGNFQLSIGQMNNSATASALTMASPTKIITLIDDSGDANDSLNYGGLPSNVRNLVSGTIDGGIYNASSPHYYGLVYPDKGVILIDSIRASFSASLGTVSSSLNGDNALRLFKSISGSGAAGFGFSARNVSVKDVSYYYVRVPARIGFSNQPNGTVGLALYSNNPTFVSGSNNTLKETSFVNDPSVYITSIGLYNDQGELLAVAKMSKPIKKTPNSELSVTVRLEY